MRLTGGKQGAELCLVGVQDSAVGVVEAAAVAEGLVDQGLTASLSGAFRLWYRTSCRPLYNRAAKYQQLNQMLTTALLMQFG